MINIGSQRPSIDVDVMTGLGWKRGPTSSPARGRHATPRLSLAHDVMSHLVVLMMCLFHEPDIHGLLVIQMLYETGL